ncbi:MAG: SpoIID/LytB domain-containing protein [Lachnospiraceae bacterium]|nr:SpoIID/LytB domain-containing protein [Lachnospiraceae bacterium]
MKKFFYLIIFWLAAFMLLLLIVPIAKEEVPEEPSVIKYLDLIDMIKQNEGSVRVILQTTDYEGIYHEKVELFYDNQDIILDENCTESNYHIAPVERGITVKSIQRTQGNPTYLGVLDIYKTEQGFVIVNEVSLEEYLCSVVPSEMPSSYPTEALKAQAICARTYSSRFFDNMGYPEYGAHMDDSVMYQVYNNIETSPEAIAAVEATSGQILCDLEGNLVDTFYYSTGHSDFEKEEPWYAWKYTVDVVDPGILQAQLAKVVDYVEVFAEVKRIEVVERGAGNVAQELLVETDTGEYHVFGEYNIRTVLCNSKADAVKQDGSTYFCKNLIPSGFIEIRCIKEGDVITGYEIEGNGFGHGNGMSQNGAKNMAAKGLAAQEILQFYYQDCQVDYLY